MFWHLKLKKKDYILNYSLLCACWLETPLIYFGELIDMLSIVIVHAVLSHTHLTVLFDPSADLEPKLSSLAPVWCRAWIWTSSHWLASHFASSTGYWHSFSASVKGESSLFTGFRLNEWRYYGDVTATDPYWCIWAFSGQLTGYREVIF